jgi:hypothetical protein
VLRPAVVMAIVDGVLATLAPTSLARNGQRDRAELQRLEREIDRLAEAIAAGGSLTSLLAALTAPQRDATSSSRCSPFGSRPGCGRSIEPPLSEMSGVTSSSGARC